MKKMNFETMAVHAGQQIDQVSHSVAAPLYQTTAYGFDSSNHAAELFSLEMAGNIYTRLHNPTTAMFEKRIASLESGVDALAVSSGQAAVMTVIGTLCKKGDNVVSSPFVYGGTYTLLGNAFARFGIDCFFAKNDSPEEIEKLINDKTKAIYLETIGNPGFSIPDFDGFKMIGEKYGIPVVVDNTFGAGGYFCKPIEFGANIVVHSATKWIGGHGTAMGGVIIDGGNFDWCNAERFMEYALPSESYHGVSFKEKFGSALFVAKCRLETLRDYGACQSPFNSREMLIGLETLHLRAQRESENAMQLAGWLLNQPEVDKVHYPGLEEDSNHKNAVKYLSNGFGCVLSVELKGTLEQTRRFVESLKLVLHVANVGDVRTLVIQPAATTHAQLSHEAQLQAGVTPSLIRISVGVEHIDDITEDFRQALDESFK